MRTARSGGSLRRLSVAVALVVTALAVSPAAQAHAFLVRSDPPAGARLASAPRQLTLSFSEGFVSSSANLTLRRVGGERLVLAAPVVRGATVRQPLPRGLRGLFVVRWRVLADDGHVSLGEFAFAVGSTAALPAVSGSTGQTSGTQVAASWLLFLGLALALGGLASERLLWRDSEPVAPSPFALALALAAVGAFAELALVAGNRRGAGLLSGMRPSALGDAVSTRPGLLSTLTLGCVLLAASAAIARRRPWAVLPLLGAVVAIGLRGHAGTSGKWWAVLAEVIHLAGAALWIGALAHLVLVVARAPGRLEALGLGVRRYSRLALPTVAVVLGSGIASAFAQLHRLGDLLRTGYGQALDVKTGLVLAALTLAAAARHFALAHNPQRVPLLRRLTGMEAAALAGVLVAVALLVNLVPPRSEAAQTAPALGPPPISGPSIRLAALAGQLVVGLTAGERQLQFTVIAPGDTAANGITLTADADRAGSAGTDLFPRSCGEGCFTIRYLLGPGVTTITAHVSAPGWQGGDASFDLLAPLPAAEPQLLGRAILAMRRVPLLDLIERVSSGPSSAAAPAGYRLTGKAFLATEAFAGGAVDVRRLAREGALTAFAFALPGSNIWYRLWVDHTFRIRREQIISPGHWIRRTFTYPRTTTPALAPATGQVHPPDGPFTEAREADDLAVGMAARPMGRRIVLTFTVIAPSGDGTNGLQLSARLDGAAAAGQPVNATACGSGCYHAALMSVDAPRAAIVTLRRLGRPPIVLRYPLPARWPPVDATAIVRRATKTFRRLHSVIYDERLASSPTQVVNSTWTLEAPNRFSYVIHGGDNSEAIVIGTRRWDRDPGQPWQASSIGFGNPQPVPFWGEPPRRAALLGTATVRGRPAWVVTFLQPGVPAWFTLWVDKATYRPLELRMVAQVHFMHHLYHDFNAAPPIRPPR